MAAIFFAALVSQVFILQGVHYIFGHHHSDEVCKTEGVQIHEEGHGHFSCDICLFHFAPSEIYDDEFEIKQPDVVFSEILTDYQKTYFSLKYFQPYLRGPPSFLA
ncbi:MAG: hypothetical protein AAF502_24380 [Bacteroidota bacterium]